MALCDEVLLAAFRHAISRHDNAITLENVPAIVWQRLGNDAIITGYNRAMIGWTHGGIKRALGAAASDFLERETFERLMLCARTGLPALYESVRTLSTCPETWQMLTLAVAHGDRVLVRSYPERQIVQVRRRMGGDD